MRRNFKADSISSDAGRLNLANNIWENCTARRNYVSEKLIGGLTALFALPRDQPCSTYFSILRISRVFDRIGNPLKKNKIVAIEENILNSFHLSMRIFLQVQIYCIHCMYIFTILFMFNSESPSFQFTITQIKWQ